MTIQTVLYLVGSPKARSSTSEALGNSVVQQLAAAGIQVHTAYSHKVFRRERSMQQFLQAYDEADLVLLAYPLYVDTLPYLVTKAFEVMVEHRAANPITQTQRLACIGNCGFPEPDHLALSMEVCREFAQEAGMAWYGGLSIGQGGAIHGAPLESIAGRVRHQVRALDRMAEALLADQPIPDEAVELASRPILPPRLYTLMGTVAWHRRAGRNAVRHELHARPYDSAAGDGETAGKATAAPQPEAL